MGEKFKVSKVTKKKLQKINAQKLVHENKICMNKFDKVIKKRDKASFKVKTIEKI